ncbi:MAG: amidohydrolase family protein [Myxococcota bacterium]
MKKLAVALVVLVAVAIGVGAWVQRQLEPPPPLALPEPGVVFTDVTLVEPGFGRREHRQLVIEGDSIARIGEPLHEPDDPFAGAFVLPGLNDLHVHFPPAAIPGQTELWSFLFLMHGVTGVRDAADVDGTATRPAIDGIRSGAFPGPRVRSCHRFVDGDPPLWGNSIVVRNPEEGVRAVEQLVAEGADCVKAYDGLDAESLAAVLDEAHSEGLPVIGHVPRAVPFEQALLDDAQHLIGVRARRPDERRFPFNQVHWQDVTDERIDFVIEQSLIHDLAHTPTLVTTERLARYRSYETLLREPDAALLPRFYREVLWNPDGGVTPAGAMGPDDFDAVDRALEAKLRTVKRMHDAGVRLHTGTDSLVYFVVPGASLHRELRLLVRAGLSPDQALALSTQASAEALGVPSLGLLRVGAPADLVVFRDDPTNSLDALDGLLAVVRDGRVYTREAMQAQLERYRAHFESAVYDTVLPPLVRRAIASTVSD